MSLRRFAAVFAIVLLLVACSGVSRRISPPTASIQQLTVNADGSWKIDLRVQNYSNITMRFADIELALAVNGQDAGSVHAAPNLNIGPVTADVVSIDFKPSLEARLYAADALSRRRSLDYTLKGRIDAAPEQKKKAREFDIDAHNSLNPAPGLDGVLR